MTWSALNTCSYGCESVGMTQEALGDECMR